MKTTRHTAFLCGCFSMKTGSPLISSNNSLWEEEVKVEKDISVMEKFYYPEFVNFCYPGKESFCSCGGMQRYRLPIDEEVEIVLADEKKHTIYVADIRVFILPYNLLIYAIQITQDGAVLDDITATLCALRSVGDHKYGSKNESWGAVMSHIVQLFNDVSPNAKPLPEGEEFNYFNLMENGNKLKLFQIVDFEEMEPDEKKQNQLLFEIGSLAPVNSYSSSGFSSPSEEYFNKITSQNKISIFNNWKGLSLFDTFTIVSYSTPPYMFDLWIKAYFSMIYIHSLFLKFYLFRMNILFRKRVDKVSNLEKEFLEFENNCCFHKISYNFLPLEIYNYLDIGLNISEERKQLYGMIEQERKVQEKENDKKMNSFLFFLTCLTIFSTIWDFSCLLDRIYPYEVALGSTMIGYRLITSILLLLGLITILGYRLSGKKKGR